MKSSKYLSLDTSLLIALIISVTSILSTFSLYISVSTSEFLILFCVLSFFLIKDIVFKFCPKSNSSFGFILFRDIREKDLSKSVICFK